MKKIAFYAFALLTYSATAQLQGEVTYTTKINMHAELPDNENSEMIKKLIPEFQEMENRLLFTETESLFSSFEEEESDEPSLEEPEGNVTIKIEMDSPQSATYMNYKEGVVVEQRDLMGKLFLIKDSIQTNDWKITDKQLTVAGLNCQRAELVNEEDTIVAWFTTQIPAPTGPSGFGGLPGLIVHVSMDNGNFQITATDINRREIGKKEIKVPTKGKEITHEEFMALEQKKIQEMQERFGGTEGSGGNVIMISN